MLFTQPPGNLLRRPFATQPLLDRLLEPPIGIQLQRARPSPHQFCPVIGSPRPLAMPPSVGLHFTADGGSATSEPTANLSSETIAAGDPNKSLLFPPLKD